MCCVGSQIPLCNELYSQCQPMLTRFSKFRPNTLRHLLNIFPLPHIYKIMYFSSLKPSLFFYFIILGGGVRGCLGVVGKICSVISSLFKTQTWALQNGRRDQCSTATKSSALRRVDARQKHSMRSWQLPRDNSSVSAPTPLPLMQRHTIDPHHCNTFASPTLSLSLFYFKRYLKQRISELYRHQDAQMA